MRVALVLGGGGVVGAAYHAGVLAALDVDLGWDARDADVIVGTSAGALVGALLATGTGPQDLALATIGRADRMAAEPALRLLVDRPELPSFGWSDIARRPHLPSAALLRAAAAPFGGVPRLSAALTMIGDGHRDLAPDLAGLDALATDWPEALRTVAVDRSSAQRVVFGPDRPAPLSAAVAASAAVPGYFRPVPIDDGIYIDGGAWSPTNVDVVAALDPVPDLVVVSSPMSSAVTRLGADLPVRRWCRGRLHAEVDELRRLGTKVLVLEPGRSVLAHMAFDLMSGAALREIVREAVLGVGRRLLDPSIAPVAARLRSAGRRPQQPVA